MYFAVDPFDVNVMLHSLASLFRPIQPAGNHEALRWFALVDRAFDHGHTGLNWPLQTLVLYEERSDLSALAGVSPSLFALPAPSDVDFDRTLLRLLRHCNGRPMLSFLALEQDAIKLIEQWSPCLKVPLSDQDEPYLLRLADTRVLPALATSPNRALWQRFAHGVRHWWFIDRDGRPQSLPTDRGGSMNLKVDSDLTLSLKDLEHLLSRGLPDNVIATIEEQLPDLLPERGRAQFYALVAKACVTAERFGVESFPDVVSLAVASQCSHGSILDKPEVKTLLAEHAWTPGELSSELMHYFPEETP